jgi:hypothetical protein
MDRTTEQAVGFAQLSTEVAAQLPGRHLMVALTLLGLPLVGVSDVSVVVDTSGPQWLAGSVGGV